jgi:hypothetical protein
MSSTVRNRHVTLLTFPTQPPTASHGVVIHP